MAFVETGNEGLLNGTSAVTVASAPSSGNRRLIRSINVYNADTVTHTIIMKKVVGANARIFAREILAPGEPFQYSEHLIVLDSTDESVTVEMAAAVSSVAPTFDVTFAEISP